MNNQNQKTIETVASTDLVTRDFVAAALTVSVLTNLTVFVAWLAVTLA